MVRLTGTTAEVAGPVCDPPNEAFCGASAPEDVGAASCTSPEFLGPLETGWADAATTAVSAMNSAIAGGEWQRAHWRRKKWFVAVLPMAIHA
ncbi:MAG TPA: hypothetical protein VGG30_04780 [Pirellulales bacterium]